MIVQTPPLLHISPLILLIFDDFGGECFFARISAISGEFSQFPALSTPYFSVRPFYPDYFFDDESYLAWAIIWV